MVFKRKPSPASRGGFFIFSSGFRPAEQRPAAMFLRTLWPVAMFSVAKEVSHTMHALACHCEERSDEAISYFTTRLPRSLRSLAMTA
jgi:hypothetical protein